VIRSTKHHEWIIPVPLQHKTLPITNGGSASSAAEHNYGKRRCNEVQLAENQYVYNAAPSPSVAFQFCPTQQKSLIRIVTVQPANAPPQLIQIPQQLQTASLPLQSATPRFQMSPSMLQTSTPNSNYIQIPQNQNVIFIEPVSMSNIPAQDQQNMPPQSQQNMPMPTQSLQNMQIQSPAIKTKTPRTPKSSNAAKHKQNPEVHSIDDEECDVVGLFSFNVELILK
jgi:hypothetical protein